MGALGFFLTRVRVPFKGFPLKGSIRVRVPFKGFPLKGSIRVPFKGFPYLKGSIRVPIRDLLGYYNLLAVNSTFQLLFPWVLGQ